MKETVNLWASRNACLPGVRRVDNQKWMVGVGSFLPTELSTVDFSRCFPASCSSRASRSPAA